MLWFEEQVDKEIVVLEEDTSESIYMVFFEYFVEDDLESKVSLLFEISSTFESTFKLDDWRFISWVSCFAVECTGMSLNSSIFILNEEPKFW